MKAAATRKKVGRVEEAKGVGKEDGEENNTTKTHDPFKKHCLLVIRSITHTASEGLTHMLLRPRTHTHTRYSKHYHIKHTVNPGYKHKPTATNLEHADEDTRAHRKDTYK